jgi:serine/threonine protein kinase
LQVRSQLSAFLSHVVCLATTGAYAWIVCAKRTLPEAEAGKMPLLALHIWSVSVSTLAELAIVLKSTSMKDPTWFLTSDGPAILSTLSSIGVSALQCRVKFHKQSMDRVYLLHLPVQHASGNEWHVSAKVASLAFKVVGDERFAQEASAVKRIAESNKIAGFYALGASSSDDVWFQTRSGVPEFYIPPQLECEYKGWWTHEHKQPEDKGVIIMRPAQRGKEPTWNDRAKLFDDVKKTLKVAHELQIVHTDIRASNILYFGEGDSGAWQLIDFGLSCALGSTVSLERDSSRAKRSGQRIKRIMEESGDANINVEWTTNDDYSMLELLKF